MQGGGLTLVCGGVGEQEKGPVAQEEPGRGEPLIL